MTPLGKFSELLTLEVLSSLEGFLGPGGGMTPFGKFSEFVPVVVLIFNFFLFKTDSLFLSFETAANFDDPSWRFSIVDLTFCTSFTTTLLSADSDLFIKVLFSCLIFSWTYLFPKISPTESASTNVLDFSLGSTTYLLGPLWRVDWVFNSGTISGVIWEFDWGVDAVVDWGLEGFEPATISVTGVPNTSPGGIISTGFLVFLGSAPITLPSCFNASKVFIFPSA